MKDFNEEFPSLKDRWKSTEEVIKLNIKLGSYISNYEVLEFCLDKQRVKEIIEKLWEEQSTFSGNYNAQQVHIHTRNFKNKILKELGLDE